MHPPRTIILMVMAIVGALAATPASAQDDLGPLEDFGQLDGIESAISRSWSVDYEALLAESPEAAAGDDPFAGIDGTIFLIGTVIEFEEDAAAESAYELYRDSVIDEFATYEAEDEVVSESPLDDLGDNAHSFDIASTAEDAEGFYRYLMVQDDAWFFIVISAATSAEATARADSLAGYLVDAGEASDDEVSFNGDGASTGGNWGFFPDDDHESVTGVVPSVDEVLYPAPDEDA